MLKSVLKVNRYSIFAYKFQLHFGFSFIKKFPAKMGKKSVKKELKERIIGLHLAQHSTREIKAILKCVSQSCVSKTIRKFKSTGTTLDKPRSGRPRKTSITDDNTIYRIARKNPKFSAKEIAQEVNLALKKGISRQTVNRRLIDRKLCAYVSARKPLLKPSDRVFRINFCRRMLKMSSEQLNKIVFSDESNYTVLNRKNRVIVRRHNNEKFHSRFITPRLQGGGGSVGIWGSITYHGPGLYSLYDGRMNQYNYIETLENALIPTRDLFFGGDPNWMFQQDNAPCHKALSVTEWFEENDIKVLQWPARSPDLNPIENLWTFIDRKLTKAPVTSAEDLKKALKEHFEGTSTQYCQSLFNSIKRRCQLCINNKGGHIPY